MLSAHRLVRAGFKGETPSAMEKPHRRVGSLRRKTVQQFDS